MSQQCPCNTQPLFLAAGNIGSALFNPRVIRIREGLNEFIRMRQLTGMTDFLIRGIFLAPAQIVPDGSREQHVFLQHHGDLPAQRFQIVLTDIVTADTDRSLRDIVKP